MAKRKKQKEKENKERLKSRRAVEAMAQEGMDSRESAKVG